jgi:leucyl/phenylalanyl-tRNA--protein transferase
MAAASVTSLEREGLAIRSALSRSRSASGPAQPIEPPSTTTVFPSSITPDPHGRVVTGGDLEPGTLLAAYRSGLFPMRVSSGELAWWSPDPRGVLFPAQLRVSKSLERSRRQFEIRVDSSFEAVVAACAERAEGEYHWITDEVRQAYTALHSLGWAHSVEAWASPSPGAPAELVGGLYGVAIGGLFCGESMFHRARDASKAALVGLVRLLDDGTDGRLIDCQWLTPHLASLGAVEISRAEYLARLASTRRLPLPAAFVQRHPEETT